MADVRRIEDLSPEEIHQYRNEFKRGMKLFQESLENYNETSEPHKKNEFKKVMNNTLDTMNEMVNVALRTHEQKINDKLKEDYEKYTSTETSQNYNEIHKDIKMLKKNLEKG